MLTVYDYSHANRILFYYKEDYNNVYDGGKQKQKQYNSNSNSNSATSNNQQV